MNDSRQQFINALTANQQIFDVSLSLIMLNKLADYYELVQKHNEFLHLVAPSSPDNFAVRHILESLFLQNFLPKNAKFADIGTGAGLPSVPLLIARKDLCGVLIESKLKKAKFLEEVVRECKLENRAEILNRQFEELAKPDIDFVTCRALDRFTEKLPKILKWSRRCGLLFFGGNNLGESLETYGVRFEQKLIPNSIQRFIFIAKN